MQLKFFARPGHMVPYGTRQPGQLRRYVGRTFKALDDKKAGIAGVLVATDTPFEVDSSSDIGAAIARSASKLDGSGMPALWAADKETADFCGIQFFQLQRGADGEWERKPETKKQSAAPGAGKE